MPRTDTTVSRDARVRAEDDWAGTDVNTPTPSFEERLRAWEDRAPIGERPAPGEWPSPGARRTVTIRGRGSERAVAPRSSASARHRNERRYERAGFKADRAAMWAVLLGLMLILAAAASAHAATLHTLVH